MKDTMTKGYRYKRTMRRPSLLSGAFAALLSLLLPCGCEPSEPSGLADPSAPMRFSVSESVPDLLTKSSVSSQEAARTESSASNVLLLTSADGRTLRLVAEEEPLSVRTSPAAVPETKAVKIYKKPASSSEVALGGDPIAVWAYNLANSSDEPKNGVPNLKTPSPKKAILDDGYWYPSKIEGGVDVRDDILFETVSGYSIRWYAVAPHTTGVVGAVSMPQNQNPTLNWTVPGTVSQQVDLLAAVSATRNRSASESDTIGLTFRHLLTGVRFKRDKNLAVTSITVSGVYDKATADLTKADREMSTFTDVDDTGAATDLWSVRAKSVAEPSWTMDMTSADWTNGHPDNATEERQYDYAGKDANILMMIPQLTPQGAKITVTVNDPVLGPTPFEGDISGHRWLPGRLVTYRIDEDGVRMETDYMELVVVPSRDNGTEYTLPFTGTFPAHTKVYWDYTPSSTAPDATYAKGASADNITHTYPADGQPHTIRIEVRAEPGAPQIPQFYGGWTPFYSSGNPDNTLDSDGKPLDAKTKKMLKSILRPILKTPGTTMKDALAGQANLTTVCEDLFSKNPQVTDFTNTFYGCAELQMEEAVQTGIFSSNPDAQSFAFTFAWCSKLVLLPLDDCKLFRNNPEVQVIPGGYPYGSFYSTFTGCTSIVTIPDHLFDANTKVTWISHTFEGCTGLTTIPEALFANNKAVEDFESVFAYCSSLKTVPDKLFYENGKVKNFRGAFAYSGLVHIPDHFFDKNLEAEMFNGTFSSCTDLEDIPPHLFDYNKKAKTFQTVFQGCRKIEEIPDKLFYHNREVEDHGFSEAFSTCISLKTVHAHLFGEKGVSEKTAIISLTGTFQNCSSLESVPESLLACFPNVKNFHGTFQCFVGYYGGLKSIPGGLFKDNPEVEQFFATFSGCKNLKTLPGELFKHNKNVTTFASAFYVCEGLESLPSGLLAYAEKCTNFERSFDRCVNLVLTPDIFIAPAEGITAENRFSQVSSVNFKQMFSNVVYPNPHHEPITVGGTAPDLWNYPSLQGKTVTKTECFSDRENLTNYADIPDEWKGCTVQH